MKKVFLAITLFLGLALVSKAQVVPTEPMDPNAP
jgi:hypothetical protein